MNICIENIHCKQNGIAQITAKPLVKGVYDVTLKFSGTISRYAATEIKQKVNVDGFVPVKMAVVSAVSDNTKSTFKIKLTDSENDKVLPNRKVNIILDGVNHVGTTNENGIAEITGKSLLKGTYEVILKFAGTFSHYSPTEIKQKVTVDGFVLVNMDVVSAVSNGTNTIFKIKLTDSENGKVLNNRILNLILNGKNLAAKTDENGVAQINAEPLQKGTYNVTLKFAGTVSVLNICIENIHCKHYKIFLKILI